MNAIENLTATTLRNIIGELELDQSLKSQPVAAQTLLETALCRLALAGSGR